MPRRAFHRTQASTSSSASSRRGRSSWRPVPATVSTTLRRTALLESPSRRSQARLAASGGASTRSAAATCRRVGSVSLVAASTRSSCSGRSARRSPSSSQARSRRRGARASTSREPMRVAVLVGAAGSDALSAAAPANSSVTTRSIEPSSAVQRFGRAIVTATKSGPTSTLVTSSKASNRRATLGLSSRGRRPSRRRGWARCAGAEWQSEWCAGWGWPRARPRHRRSRLGRGGRSRGRRRPVERLGHLTRPATGSGPLRSPTPRSDRARARGGRCRPRSRWRLRVPRRRRPSTPRSRRSASAAA